MSRDSDWHAILTRNAETQAFNIALCAGYEEVLRTSAVKEIDKAIIKLHAVRLDQGISQAVLKSEKALFIALHDICDTVLEDLHHTTTPIGKSALPRMVNMWEYPEVVKLSFEGKSKEAMILFRNAYVQKVGLTDPMLDRLKYGSWILGITSAAITAYNIATSASPATEVVHQATLLAGGLTGAFEVGALSVGPCMVCGIYAPVCVGASSFLGGILGTEATEQLWQFSKTLPAPSFGAHAASTDTAPPTTGQEQKSAIKHNVAIESWLNVLRALKKIQPNSASPQTTYEIERVLETFSEHMRQAGSAYYYQGPTANSKNHAISRLAQSYFASPKTFLENSNKVSEIILRFLNEKNPGAKAFVEKTFVRIQIDYLNYLEEMAKFSEITPVGSLDTLTKSMDAAGIPEDSRAPFYQQGFSVLPQVATTSSDLFGTVKIDQDKLRDLRAELTGKLDKLSKQFSNLEKNSECHFAEFKKSLKTLTDATNDNAAAIQALTAGQKEIVAFFKTQQVEADAALKKQQTQEEIAGYKAFGQFVSMLGNATDEPIISDLGTLCIAGAMAYEASVRIAALTAASSFGACLGPYALAAMAAIMVVSLFMKKKTSPQEDPFRKQVIDYFQSILSHLDQFEKNMHARFDRLENIALETRRLMLISFDAVLYEVRHAIALELYCLYGLDHITAKVDLLSSNVVSGFRALQKTPVNEVVLAIENPAIRGYLMNLKERDYIDYVNRLVEWLTVTSCQPMNNGYAVISANRYARLTLRHDFLVDVLNIEKQDQLREVLGLLAGITNHHVKAQLIKNPEGMPNVNQWSIEAVHAYEKLLTTSNPTLEKDKTTHLAEIKKMKDCVTQVKEFVKAISTSAPLFLELSKQYNAAILEVKKIIQEHFKEQERQFYRKNAIPVADDESLIGLHETASKAALRQNSQDFLNAFYRTHVTFYGFLGLDSSEATYRFDPNAPSPQYCFHDRKKAEIEWQNTAFYNFNTLYDQVGKPVIQRLGVENIQRVTLFFKLQFISINHRELKLGFDMLSGMKMQHSFAYAISKGKQNIPLLSGKFESSASYPYQNGAFNNISTHTLPMVLAADMRHPNSDFTVGWQVTSSIGVDALVAINQQCTHELHVLIAPYRKEAIRSAKLDTHFQAALERLESCRLQSVAFMRLLEVEEAICENFTSMNREAILEKLETILKSDPNDAIIKTQCFLREFDFALVDENALFTGVISSVSIEKNALHKWAEDSLTQLTKIENAIGLWSDNAARQQAQSSSSAEVTQIEVLQAQLSTLMQRNAEQSQKMDILLATLNKEQAQFASQQRVGNDEDNDYETDNDDESRLETQTQMCFKQLDIAIAGSPLSLWNKPGQAKPGVRQYVGKEDFRLDLFDFFSGKTNRGKRVSQEKTSKGNTALVVQLAVRKNNQH